MNEKKLILSAFFIVIVASIISVRPAFRGSPITNSPYIVYVERVDQEMFAHCRMDPNCMDLLTWDDLPKR